jgi:adenine-specific DNA-methyltransferase
MNQNVADECSYLTSQLIAYLGNKRSLLGFLKKVFKELESRFRIKVFLDPFAGSGAVSRLARTLGYRVLANDWEFYSSVINRCHLAVERRELDGLYVDRGGIDRVLDELNGLSDGVGYIGRHYAPRITGEADYRRERLFYTAENARRIDSARDRIEKWYPGFDLPQREATEKTILLAALLYESATHTNTSGVFKACHKGFGGHSRDALKRILEPIRLERPVLIDGQVRGEVHSVDAKSFVSSRSGDLCYLDPPYASHQYGSNYHLLNTIALWDKLVIDNGLRADGRLRNKAAIRKDWVKTRSAFCYRHSALDAMAELLDSIDARFLALSYNSDGIISLDELLVLLYRHGKVDLYSTDYVIYRGGKQSAHRRIHNAEFLLVVDRNGINSAASRQTLQRKLLERRVRGLLRQSFYPEKIEGRFTTEGQVRLVLGSRRIPMYSLYRFDLPSGLQTELIEGLLHSIAFADLSELRDNLVDCLCSNRKDEIGVLLRILQGTGDSRARHQLFTRVLWLLRKLAFRKHRESFFYCLGSIKNFLERETGSVENRQEDLLKICELAEARFKG